MFQGYHVHLARPAAYHYGLLYTEARLGSLIAIGKGDVPAAHWFKLHRTLPNTPEYAWQSQPPLHRVAKRMGPTYFGGYYEWQGVRFVPSWGGSMFEALMPSLVLDELLYAPLVWATTIACMPSSNAAMPWKSWAIRVGTVA